MSNYRTLLPYRSIQPYISQIISYVHYIIGREYKSCDYIPMNRIVSSFRSWTSRNFSQNNAFIKIFPFIRRYRSIGPHAPVTQAFWRRKPKSHHSSWITRRSQQKHSSRVIKNFLHLNEYVFVSANTFYR